MREAQARGPRTLRRERAVGVTQALSSTQVRFPSAIVVCSATSIVSGGPIRCGCTIGSRWSSGSSESSDVPSSPRTTAGSDSTTKAATRT
jgi:hypothetical protein